MESRHSELTGLPRSRSTKYKARSTFLDFRPFHQSKLFQRPAKHCFRGHENDHNTLQHIDDIFRNMNRVSINKDAATQKDREQDCGQENSHRMITSQERDRNTHEAIIRRENVVITMPVPEHF